MRGLHTLVVSCFVLSLGCAPPPKHKFSAGDVTSTNTSRQQHSFPHPVRLVEIRDSRRAGDWAGSGVTLEAFPEALCNGLPTIGVTVGGETGMAPFHSLTLEIISASLNSNTGMRSFNVVLRASLDTGEPWVIRGTVVNVPWNSERDGYRSIIRAGIDDALAKLQTDLVARTQP